MSGAKEEQWKDVIGFERKYQISDLGNCRYILKDGYRYIKRFESRNGYFRFYLSVRSKKISCLLVHREVAKLFVPNPLSLPQVNHIDGDKGNNKADNLEWVTASQNQCHALDKGLRKNVGEGHYMAEASLEDVLEAVALLKIYHSPSYIKNNFPTRLSRLQISRIKNGSTWRRVLEKHGITFPIGEKIDSSGRSKQISPLP